MDITVTMLGGFAVTVHGQRLDESEWRRRQAAALVKVLALTPSRTLHREQVMDSLWPELSVDAAAPRLHKAAHYARRALQLSESVVLAGDTVALFPAHDVQVDATVFEELATGALAARDRSAAVRAIDAYRGALLPHDVYEPWALEARGRLHMLYLDMLRLAESWDTLALVEPTDEDAHLHLIAGMAHRGEYRSALRQFERLERAMRTELGVGPSKAAIRVRDELRRVSVAPAVTPASDTGELVSSIATHGQRTAEPGGGVAAPPLIGRSSIQDRLTETMSIVESGHGRSVFLSGSAGVGKTALLSWLDRTATGRGWRVGNGVAAQVEGAWPYAPVLEAFADLCRRHPTLLDGLDDSMKTEIENGLSGREIAWTAQSGHQRLFVAAAELLRLAAAGAGTLLIIDDAHQADDASLRLLHYLARTTFAERALIAFGYRPNVPAALAQVRQSLDSHRSAVTHELSPLGRDDTLALVRRMSPASTDDSANSLWLVSAGSPFSVVELARKEADESHPAGESHTTTLTEEQIQICAAAAVLGMTFDTDEFLRVTGLPEDDAYGVLDAAVAQRLFVRTEIGYAFRHSMLRESLLNGLPPSRIRALHRQAATTLQELNGSPSRIGHHLVQAGEHAAAVAWMLRAAETSAALGANRDALAVLESVRAQAQGAELGRLLSLRADLLMAAADAGAVEAYSEALAAVVDPADSKRIRARLARAATFAGDLDTAMIALDGLTVDGSAGDPDLLLAQGNLALFRGDLDAAAVAASEARRRVTLWRPDDWQMFDLIALQGLIAHNRGEWFERLRLEMKSGAERPAFAARIFDSHLCVAEYLLYGPTPYPEVLELADELQATAERSGVLRAVAFATALRGETALLMGDLAKAAIELREAADLHHDIGSTAGEAHSLQRLAEVRLAQDDRGEANRLLRRALTLARFTSIAQHLLQRIYGTMISAAPDRFAARAIVDHADAALGKNDHCLFCVIMLALPAARACAEVGDLDDARHRLHQAEVSARMWEGTSWQASILETRSFLASAAGDDVSARDLRLSAADLFDASGQPLDAQRCRSELIPAG
jgi:DNA-binding SARP family transcriptional activator/tetratricopeptide (TPR) repeat protein